MCGIVGKINLNNENVKKEEIQKMINVLRHRGPDGENIYINNNIGFGHVLLKIQDLSNESVQPYEFENLIMTYNGEIYNYVELKTDLTEKGYTFDTAGDTEVLIKHIHCFGLKETLNRIEGCYAIGLYNKESGEKYIIRDRLGIKPLYYYLDNQKLVFASEIKSIIEDKSIKRQFDLETIAISLNCKLWMDQEKTLFKNINMLKPGTYIKINEKNNIEIIKYYELKFSSEYQSPEKLINDFSKEFIDSVKKKQISKVPIAAFLSGGIDSSLVCKLLNDNMDSKLNTYTIHYDYDNDLDLNYANKLKEDEGFEQHNILITEDMYNLDNIDKVTYFVEEILIDKVYIPMYFNYKAAKDDGYTVVVSGQGSDEVWLGYVYVWKIFQYLDKSISYDGLLNDYYLCNMIFKDNINSEMKSIIKKAMLNYLKKNLQLNKNDLLNSYADLSLKTILHDLLMQEDKIAMANSVESRVPFVDNHRIVELAYKASSNIKLYDNREKYIVRKFAEGKINKEIIEREKYPFPEPPSVYNGKIKKLCSENWNEIKESNIIKKIIDNEKLNDINSFTDIELWTILVYWRFEKVFDMEV